MRSKFYGCFRHETCFSKDCTKIAKLWVETKSRGHRLGDIDDVQWRSRFTQKGHNWRRILGVRLWHWNQSQIIPMKSSRIVKTAKSTSSSVKCEGFAYCFLRLQWRGASWILCHMVIRTIRNTTFKLCADCAKQFVRNAQNCGETNHEFWTMIKHQPTHRCLCVSFWPQAKPSSCLNHRIRQTWPPADFFLFPKLKTPMKGKRFVTIEELKEKSKQELLAIPDSSFKKCFEDWKARLA